MRFIILAASLTGLTITGVATGKPPAQAARCPDDPIVHLTRPGEPIKQRKLSDLPPANAYLAVLRRDANGCTVPVIAGYGFGSNDRRAAPRRP